MQEPSETPITETPAAETPGAENHQRKSTRRLFLEFIAELAVIAAAVWVLLTFFIGLTIHYGNNMFPAIRDGDLVISWRLQRPYLNAAVLYVQDGKLCAGRVVGMPGNVIDISDDGVLTVNGVLPAEEIFYPTFRAETGGPDFPYTVGADQVFILNDFRSSQNDSRTFGAVDLTDVRGPVLLLMRRRGF